MAGGFDEKSGGAQMGVMQGPMVRERWWDLLPLPCSFFFFTVNRCTHDLSRMLHFLRGQKLCASKRVSCPSIIEANHRIPTSSSGAIIAAKPPLLPLWSGAKMLSLWQWEKGRILPVIATGWTPAEAVTFFFTSWGHAVLGFNITWTTNGLKDKMKQHMPPTALCNIYCSVYQQCFFPPIFIYDFGRRPVKVGLVLQCGREEITSLWILMENKHLTWSTVGSFSKLRKQPLIVILFLAPW